MNRQPIRGQVWIVDLNPTVGHEQAKKRPCVIISADTYNKGPMKLAVVLPITSQYRNLSWFVEINPPEGGLNKKSYVICNQIRTVSLERFSGNPVGFLNNKTLLQIDHRLRILLCL